MFFYRLAYLPTRRQRLGRKGKPYEVDPESLVLGSVWRRAGIGREDVGEGDITRQIIPELDMQHQLHTAH